MFALKAGRFISFLLLMLFFCYGMPCRATDFNALGYQAYKKGDMKKALELFRKAIDENPNHALAHYNYACTIAVYRTSDPCDYAFGGIGEIFDHLEISIKIDPQRRKRAQEDPDLDLIKGTVRFNTLMGLRLDRDADLKRILCRTSWYGISEGGIGPESLPGMLDFSEDGTVSGTCRLFSLQQAKFTIKNGVIIVECKDDSKTSDQSKLLELTVSKEGSIHYKGRALFNDYPDNCNT